MHYRQVPSFERVLTTSRIAMTRSRKSARCSAYCPMAATQIADGLELKHGETNPLTLLRKAYGI